MYIRLYHGTHICRMQIGFLQDGNSRVTYTGETLA